MQVGTAIQAGEMADDVAAKDEAPKGILSRLFRRGERARGSGRVSRFRRAFSNDRLIGLTILAALVAVRLADPLPLEILRLKVFDYYQQLKPREIPKNSPVVIIDLDENSLKEVGQWPWPRTTVAEMVRKLFEKGVVVVGFDVVFAESDRMSGPIVAKSMPGLDDTTRERLSSMKSNDDVFADIIRASKRVVLGQGALYASKELQKITPMPSSVFQRTPGAKFRKPEHFLPKTLGMVRNLPELEKAVLDKRGGLRNGGIGMFSLLPEPDGIVRRVPAFISFVTAPSKEGAPNRQTLVSALSLEMLRIAFRRPMIAAWSDAIGINRVTVAIRPRLDVTTDTVGRMWPYFSRSDRAKYIPAKDVLNGTVPIEKLRGKLAIVGTSAVGLLDIKTIPTERFIPGVEVHAQLIETIVNKTYLNRRLRLEGWQSPIDLNAAEYLLAFLGGLLMIILVPWVGAKWTLLLFLTLAGGAAGTSWYLFTQHLALFDPVFPVALIFALYVLLTYTNYAREERQQRETRGAFAKYMSPEMVAKVVEDPTLLTLGGDKRNMTLLFCDVRGFTTISEQFGAEGLTVLINKLLTPLTNVILDSGGTVDKYMGDCIMAFWNAPLDVADHPRKACHAALGMMKAMGPLNETLAAEAVVDGRTHYDLKVGIGLNSGDAVVGNMGTAQRMDYSVLGDTVNTAARLEGQSKSYGVDIVIGPQTAECVPDMAVVELDLIQVKGKTVGLNIYALMGDEEMAQSPEFLALKSAIDRMLAAYRGQKWDEAKAILKDCYEKGEAYNLAELGDLYAARIKAYEAEPPGADWNGVFIATTK
jgi:adenylate cyclase